MQITDLVKFLNIGKNMNHDQIKQTSELILSEYNYLTIDDVRFVLKGAKMGKYGRLYDVLDGQNILIWFSEYDKERDNKIIELNEAENRLLSASFNCSLLLPDQDTELTEERNKQLNELIHNFGKTKLFPEDFGKRNVVATHAQQEERIKQLKERYG